MEDIIDIIVTETTNLIEITSQPTDEIIDVNIIDNREDVTLNVTPTVVEININSLTGNFGVNWGQITGTLSNQTDLQAVLNAKADLVDGKVPSSQLPSYVDDVVEVANYAALPVTGEVGKIYITLDTNFIYRWSGSTYIEIKDSSAVWGAITGTLSSQTDLQSALDAKVPYTGATGNVNLGEYGATVGYLGFDTTPTSTPTGIGTTYWDSFYRTLSLIDGDGDTTLQIGQEERVLVHNNTGSTLTDGQVVYVIGSTGELPSVALASNTSETTSSVTFGIVTESIAHGANGFITTSGIIHGLNTNAFTEGAALYLGSTAGTFTETKPIAPANSVLVGYVIKKAGGNGSIFVKIQNGYELEELHDVLITSKANNDGLFYESSSGLWKNKSISTVLGYSPEQPLTFSSPLIRTTNAISIPVATATINGYLSSTDWTTFNSKVSGSGATGRYAIWTSPGVISDGFIQTTSNITYVEGMGLNTINGLDIEGNYGGGTGGLKLRSYDETTGKAFMEFINTSGVFRLGIEGSTGGGILPGSTAYATVLTSGLTAKNLEFGTNNTKRMTIDGTSGAVTLTGALSGTSATFSNEIKATALSGGGALYLRGNSASNLAQVYFFDNTETTLYHYLSGNATELQIRAQGARALSFYTNSNERLTITSSGNVGIGTTSPSYPLHVLRATGSDYIAKFEHTSAAVVTQGVLINTPNDTSDTSFLLNVQSASTSRFVVKGNGNVGIGTTSPGYLLHLVPPSTSSDANNTNTGSTANLYNYFVRQKGASNGISGIQYMLQTFSDAGANGMEIYTQGASSTLVFGTAATERMRITSGGDTQIAAGKAIYCYGTDAKSYGWTNLADGNLSFTSVQFGVKATIGAFSGIYTPLSDINKKKDFELSTKGLESILGLKPTLYRYKDDVNNEYNKTLGFIAQEVNEFIPEAYVETGNVTTKFIGLDYNAIVATLVKAVQEQQAQIEELKNK